jgi:hypothetical protein
MPDEHVPARPFKMRLDRVLVENAPANPLEERDEAMPWAFSWATQAFTVFSQSDRLKIESCC